MLLCGTARIFDIISRKSSLNLDLLTLRRKLMDFQKYAAGIGDNEISMDDMLNCPSSLFSRLSSFMAYSHNSAMNGASQKFAGVIAMNQANMQNIDANQMELYKQSVFKSLYDNERERFKRVEEKLLNAEETKIQQEISQKETELQMLENEEKSTKEAVQKYSENSAPKYS